MDWNGIPATHCWKMDLCFREKSHSPWSAPYFFPEFHVWFDNVKLGFTTQLTLSRNPTKYLNWIYIYIYLLYIYIFIICIYIYMSDYYHYYYHCYYYHYYYYYNIYIYIHMYIYMHIPIIATLKKMPLKEPPSLRWLVEYVMWPRQRVTWFLDMDAVEWKTWKGESTG